MSLVDDFKRLNIPEKFLEEYFLFPVIILCQDTMWVDQNIEDYCNEEKIDDEFLIDTYRITVKNNKTNESFWARVKCSLFDEILMDDNMDKKLVDHILEHVFCEFHLMLINPEWSPNDEPFTLTPIGIMISGILVDIDDLEFFWEPDFDIHLNVFQEPKSQITLH